MTAFRLLTIAAAAACLVSCSGKASISGTIQDAPQAEIIVKKLDVNKYVTLDTLTTGKSGEFAYKTEVKKAQPEFVYIFSGEKKLASMLLQSGEKVQLKADLSGEYSISGSPESEKLQSVEKAEFEFVSKFNSLSAELDKAAEDAQAEIAKKLSKLYVDYYRDRVQYVMANYKSLTVIPVLYQTFGNSVPVFSQDTDAIHFKNCSDSLMTVYPESKYVKALEAEAQRRLNVLGLSSKIAEAQQTGYVDIVLPDINAQKVKLSEVKAKIVMLYFWSAAANEQKMFNLDVMKPIYDAYHSKGFEVYAVSLDTDKALWASTVRNQNLNWINVCDGMGPASRAVGAYNITSIPTAYFIIDGEIVTDAGVTDEASLRKYISSKL